MRAFAQRPPLDQPPPKRADSNAWTQSVLIAPPPAPGGEDWVVTNVAAAVRSVEDEASGSIAIIHDDGTPIEGTQGPAPAPPVSSESAFVAGEIDVPTPPPEKVEFTAASKLLGGSNSSSEPADPDTGSRTPPIERR